MNSEPRLILGRRHILYEDNHLLVVNKPSGIATMGAREGEPSLHGAACEYVRNKYCKPGKVYLGVVSRLDRLVSGVVVFARTSKAAARLNQQFLARSVRKAYWGLVAPPPADDVGQLRDWLWKDDRQQRMLVSATARPEAQEARLAFHVLDRHGQFAWLNIDLQTGRKHQIRVQLSHRGWPIVGDRKYGSHTSFPAGIALHARALSLRHPVRPEEMRFAAPLPGAWQQFRRQQQWTGDWPQGDDVPS